MSLDYTQAPHTTVPSQVLNALTIDCEEWFHGLTRTNIQPDTWSTMTRRAESAVAILLDILDQAGVRATFFMLGDLARHSPTLVKRLAEAGHELGSHGYAHRPVYRLNPVTFREDLDQTRDIIQQPAGMSVVGFRAPYFSIDQIWTAHV